MLISIILLIASAALGIWIRHLVVGVVLSLFGGGWFSEAHYDYDIAVFNAVILLFIALFYFLFAKHLIEEKKEPLLTLCFSISVIFFFTAHWLLG
ncbi:hypothetical protein J7E73_21655 [Paenibacillus albidus]|uniref:hypothetical protein n=1 Tax=Paenibacillus albidus TaxID=2041023 RepID=UPI001BED3624|nr:hypothetical protein [Paenibacillus albidus]MBT2291686.1 hypothetical protein [Paenibacillus albidus]